MTTTSAAWPDQVSLWWLADPEAPRLIGSLRRVRRNAAQPAGVSLEDAPAWLREGLALSEDLPLKAGEFMPTAAWLHSFAVLEARQGYRVRLPPV